MCAPVYAQKLACVHVRMEEQASHDRKAAANSSIGSSCKPALNAGAKRRDGIARALARSRGRGRVHAPTCLPSCPTEETIKAEKFIPQISMIYMYIYIYAYMRVCTEMDTLVIRHHDELATSDQGMRKQLQRTHIQHQWPWGHVWAMNQHRASEQRIAHQSKERCGHGSCVDFVFLAFIAFFGGAAFAFPFP